MPLCFLTLIMFYTMSTSLELSCTTCALPYIYAGYCLGGMGFHPEAKNSFIWKFGHLSLIKDPPSGYWFSPLKKILYGVSGYLSLMQDIIFGLLVFTPKANSIWGLRLSKSYGGHHLRAIGFHPEKIINGVSVIRG